jgi:enterochelin esterase-like enzyme
MDILRVKHSLNITTDPNQSTVIGSSYGGLAAFYLGLTKPNIFAHVMAQSPAFLAQPLAVLDKMIGDFAEQNKRSSFIFELGSYENNEIAFEDGTIQTTSSFEVVHHVCEHMQKQKIPTTYHEFVGGHNYVCYRVSLYDRIKEVYYHQAAPKDDNTVHCS